MKRAYISGPMTGFENFEANFNTAEEALVDAGYQVVNPAKIPMDDYILEGVEKLVGQNADWVSYLFRDLTFILACTHILFLPGWTHSFGAKVEFFFATKIGLKIMFVEMEEAEEFLQFHGFSFHVKGTVEDDKDEDWFKRQMGG